MAEQTTTINTHDCRGLASLTPAQLDQLSAAKASDDAARRSAQLADFGVPCAPLNSGYAIPLVGLGTW